MAVFRFNFTYTVIKTGGLYEIKRGECVMLRVLALSYC